MMSGSEHRRRHEELHDALDELVADWTSHTGRLPSKATILELMHWSAAQTSEPVEFNDETRPS